VGVRRSLVDRLLRRPGLFLQDREQETTLSLSEAAGTLIARRSGGGEAVIKVRERSGYYKAGDSESKPFSLKHP